MCCLEVDLAVQIPRLTYFGVLLGLLCGCLFGCQAGLVPQSEQTTFKSDPDVVATMARDIGELRDMYQEINSHVTQIQERSVVNESWPYVVGGLGIVGIMGVLVLRGIQIFVRKEAYEANRRQLGEIEEIFKNGAPPIVAPPRPKKR